MAKPSSQSRMKAPVGQAAAGGMRGGRLPQLTRRNLPLLLLQAREAVFSRFRPILNAVGVTEQQWRIIRALLDRGPLEPRQLGQLCCLSSPSLAGILTRMDDLGFVHRERLDHDQRRVLVTVTEKGRTLAVRIAPKIEQTYRLLEQDMGADFMRGFYQDLDVLLEKLAPQVSAQEED